MKTFTIDQPLPAGTSVLEASAGTGKTWTIAALATRFVAEGTTSIDDLLLVTFSRAATAELRSRVRERLRSSRDALRAYVDACVPPSDPVDTLLVTGPGEEVRARAERVASAFDDFDRATIMTTHEFCNGMIRGLGVLARQEPSSTLVEDLRPLAREVAADVYLQRYADGPQPFPFTDAKRRGGDASAVTIASEATQRVGSLMPAEGRLSSERVAFASAVRVEFEARKRRVGVHSFDDQLSRLAEALDDPDTGRLAAERLARRYSVVLIDEFQDTDPIQWRILSSAFHGRCTLVLIGDPKQAIYGFRGGDVHTYLAAASEAGERMTLGTNHRADPAVVADVAALFAGCQLGEGIGVPAVRAHRESPRLIGAPGTPWAGGVQVRAFTPEKSVQPWVAQRWVRDDLVGVVGSLLGEAPPLRRRDGEQLRPADIAVLVRSNYAGRAVAEALGETGIPATFSGTSSVFASDAARDWVALLEALEEPRTPFVERAQLTDFVGATFSGIATASDEQRSTWSQWLHGWARTLDRSGVPALMAAIDRDTDFTARLLGRQGGARLVTDHRHIAELLHAQCGRPGQPQRDLLAWLRRTMFDAQDAGQRTRRLDTDADAVQIMTIHRAKGLGFPVVLLPDAATVRRSDGDGGQVLDLPTHQGRVIDVAGRMERGRPERWRAHEMEDADQELRSLYVSLTRAESHAVAWWADHWDVDTSPLHRLLFTPHDGPPTRPAASQPQRLASVDGLVAAPPGLESIAFVNPAEPSAVAGPATPTGGSEPLSVRRFNRTIDHTWRRTSYSGLTADVHAEHEPLLLPDEPEDEAISAPGPASGAPSPMADLPGGTSFGSLVHAVYETSDPSDPSWPAPLDAVVASALPRHPVSGVTAAQLVTAMGPSFDTPLGPLAPGLTLRSFQGRDRLCELDFEFALANPSATLADIASLLATHLPADDPLHAYPDRLASPGLASQQLHGFLTGSIDVVLRRPDGGCLVVDYKTNRLAPPDVPLTVGHYTPVAMAEAMMASHYPLQALLYCVALHRFQAVRQVGYQPQRHLAGVLYLFVRGMAGPETPVSGGHPLGVFSWHPPAELVLAVSALLAREES